MGIGQLEARLVSIVCQNTKYTKIRIQMEVLLLRHTNNTNNTNYKEGVADLKWLQASQLEAHLVCIVSQSTKSSN